MLLDGDWERLRSTRVVGIKLTLEVEASVFGTRVGLLRVDAGMPEVLRAVAGGESSV